MSHFVYVLRSEVKKGSCYVGYSVDPIQRLRKHNGLIKGGARPTSRTSFQPWRLTFYLTADWLDNINGLRLEWALKKTKGPKRVMFRGEPGLTRKLNDLLAVFNKPRWVTKSPKFQEGKEPRIYIEEKYIETLKPLMKDLIWKPTLHVLTDEVNDVLNEFQAKKEGQIKPRRKRQSRPKIHKQQAPESSSCRRDPPVALTASKEQPQLQTIQ